MTGLPETVERRYRRLVCNQDPYEGQRNARAVTVEWLQRIADGGHVLPRVVGDVSDASIDARRSEGHPCAVCGEPSRTAYIVGTFRWLDLCHPHAAEVLRVNDAARPPL